MRRQISKLTVDIRAPGRFGQLGSSSDCRAQVEGAVVCVPNQGVERSDIPGGAVYRVWHELAT